MSRTEHIINELDQLSSKEMEEVYKVLITRISKALQVSLMLEYIKDKGKGIWSSDAQAYINTLRDDRTL